MLKSPVASSSATTSTKILRVRRTINKFKPNLATAKPPRPHFVAALMNAANLASASSAALEVVEEDLPSIPELVENNYGVEEVDFKVQENYFD